MSKSNVTTKSSKRLSLWIRQIATWAKDGLKNIFPYVILMVVLYAIIFLPNFMFNCKEIEIRWFGLIFQIIGFVVVVWQLDDRLKLFRKPSFLSSIANYWRRFPSRNTKNIGLSAHASFGVLTGDAKISVRPGSNSSLERRVEILEDEIEDIIRDMRIVEKTLNRHKEDNKNSLEMMRQENRKSFDRLERLMDEAVVGGIHLEWVGILYFLAGIVLATTAPEIAIWRGYSGQCSQ